MLYRQFENKVINMRGKNQAVLLFFHDQIIWVGCSKISCFNIFTTKLLFFLSHFFLKNKVVADLDLSGGSIMIIFISIFLHVFLFLFFFSNQPIYWIKKQTIKIIYIPCNINKHYFV